MKYDMNHIRMQITNTMKSNRTLHFVFVFLILVPNSKNSIKIWISIVNLKKNNENFSVDAKRNWNNQNNRLIDRQLYAVFNLEQMKSQFKWEHSRMTKKNIAFDRSHNAFDMLSNFVCVYNRQTYFHIHMWNWS